MSLVDRSAAEVASRQHGVFAACQIPELTKHHAHHRVVSGRWEALGRGVYAVNGTPATWERRIWHALLTAGQGSVVGRRSAARLHRLPGTGKDVVDIVQPEASVPLGKPRTSRRTSRLPAHHLTVVDGFPVTIVERTLFDLAGLTSFQRRRRGWVYLPAARVERMIDDALVRDQVSVLSLSRMLGDLAGRGRPGTQLIRQLLEDRSGDFVATESELEDLFVAFVASHDLPIPRRQVTLGSSEEFLGRVDFLFEQSRLIVELDGSRFHDQPIIAKRDRRRDLKLRAAGWETVRIDWWQLVDEPEVTANDLRSVIISRAS